MAHRAAPTLLTTKAAALCAGVTPATIRGWKRRGILTPTDDSVYHQPLYRVEDVAKALETLAQRTPKPRPTKAA